MMQIFKLYGNYSINIDLSLIGKEPNVGKVITNKAISKLKCHSLYLINQSPTGFYEERIDLLSEDLK